MNKLNHFPLDHISTWKKSTLADYSSHNPYQYRIMGVVRSPKCTFLSYGSDNESSCQSAPYIPTGEETPLNRMGLTSR